MFVFIIFERSHDAVSKMCQLELCFQNLPFSKSVGKKMCRIRVNGRPIRHIFHCFQGMPASCERNLKQKWYERIDFVNRALESPFFEFSKPLKTPTIEYVSF